MSADSLPSNCLVLSKQGNKALREMFAEAQPGDEINVTLKNGVSTIELKFCIDENLGDRVSGQLEDENVEEEFAEGEGDEPEEANPRAIPGDGVGAAAMAVMGRPGMNT